MRTLRFLLPYTRPYLLPLAVTVANMIALVGAQLLIPWVIKTLIAAVQEQVTSQQAMTLVTRLALLLLAVWETLIGLGLIFGVWMRITLLLLFVQMLGTITPVFFFPQEVFTAVPYAPTLEGQYIIKNMVIISAAIVLGATVRGGAIVADPRALRKTKTKETR